MKRFFVCFAVMTAMVFIVGCGGSDNNSSGGSSGSSVCSYGDYECHGNDSYFCGYSGDDLMWLHSESCSNGCDYYSGRCSSGSNGGSGDNGSGNNGSFGNCHDIYECYSQCYDSDCAQACYDNGNSYGQSQFAEMYNCWDQNGCFNASSDNEFTDCVYDNCYDETDTCLNGSNNSGGDNSNDNSAECTSGIFKCVGNESHYCNSNGSWVYDSRCENGCDSSTGKCKTNSGNDDPDTSDSGDNGDSDHGDSSDTNTDTCTTIEGKTWSSLSSYSMMFDTAQLYCDTLTECGYSDWRLPTIDELRSLIQNCPNTEIGGPCGLTDSCHSEECKSDACYGCEPSDYTGGYNKLGTTEILTSSVTIYDSFYGNYFPLGVFFSSGWVASMTDTYKFSVRCVR